MSTANMWSDDSDADASSSIQHQSTADPPHADMFTSAAGPWIHFAAGLEVDETRPAEMEVDEASFNSVDVVANNDLMIDDDDDDDDDDDGGGGAHLDMLGVTNILSQGMASEEDLGFFEDAPLNNNPHNHHHFGPLPYTPMPALAPLPTNGLPAVHLPAPPTWGLPPIMAPMPMPGVNGQGAVLTAINANDASLLHLHQHLPFPPHPQNLNPNAASNPHATALGPENYDIEAFVRFWAFQYVTAWRGSTRDTRYPWPKRIEPQMSESVSKVTYKDLQGDRRDVQGIDWEDLGVTRSDARERRSLTYKNYVNIAGSDRWQENQDVLPCTENYFRFRRLDVRKNINLVHFQLRNVLASTSRSQVFYPGLNSVHEFNPITGKGKSGMRSRETPHFQASTLAAAHGVLVAGGFFGEYCFRRTSPESSGDVHEGTITSDNSGITNHVQLHLSRSSAGPKASFASNDNGFRVLDIETDRFISETWFEKPINCTAMSPDLRLRVVVGDQKQVLITKAEPDGKPEILHALEGHGDFGFSCAWADDGWTVATGFQDKAVKIWDARRWTDSHGRAIPVCTLRSELAGCRSLKFSPLGSGKRVLVAAEEADFVSIYDAQNWQSKQTFDFFGEIGGTTFVNEGQDLQILCTDRTRGGLFQLERCGMGAERSHDTQGGASYSYRRNWKNGSYDWPEFDTTPRLLPRHSQTHRRRRALNAEPMDPF